MRKNRINMVKIPIILFFLFSITFFTEDSTAVDLNFGLSKQEYISNPITEVQHKNFVFPSKDYQFPSGPHAFTHPDDYIPMGIALIIVVVLIRATSHYYTKKRSKYLESSDSDYETTENYYNNHDNENTDVSTSDGSKLQLRVIYPGEWEGRFTDFYSDNEYREVKGYGNKSFQVYDYSKPGFEEVMIPKTLKKIFPKTADEVIKSGKEVMFDAFFNIVDGGDEVLKLEVIRDGEVVESANSEEDSIGGYKGSVSLYYVGKESKKSLLETLKEDAENSKMKQKQDKW